MERSLKAPAASDVVAVEVCTQLDARLVRVLGSGAHKLVFLIDLGGRPLALKIAPVSASLRARFERETAALQSCHHPAIATLVFSLTHVSDGKEYWVIAEEYLCAGTLENRLRQRCPFSPDEVRQIALPLAGALEHLCDRALVHRDIKPANILFRSEDEPVLSDFGIVRALNEPSLTHDFLAQGPGTPFYAAPEQLLNEKASIDWRTDQFGLALALAECALGRHAYADPGSSPRDAIGNVANRKGLPDKTVQELNELGLGNLVKALAPWPVQRYRQPRDFIGSFSREA